MKKLLVIGSMNMDFVTDLPRPLAVGETILAKNLRLVPGGKGANQAYAMGKLGGEVSMLGAVGADLHGERLCESLGSVGVDISAIRKAGDSPTGMAVISVLPNGDNSILVLQGANAQVTPDYVKEHHKILIFSSFKRSIPSVTSPFTPELPSAVVTSTSAPRCKKRSSRKISLSVLKPKMTSGPLFMEMRRRVRP